MEEVVTTKRKTGLIAGTICFFVLFSPLLFVMINRAKADWEEYFGSWLIFFVILLGSMIIPVGISVFFGRSIAKRSRSLVIQSSFLVSVALIIIVAFSLFMTIARFR